MSSISVPSGLLLLEEAHERENRQSKTSCLSPLHLSVDRQLWHLPGGLGCYKKHHFQLGPAWNREACVQERNFMR